MRRWLVRLAIRCVDQDRLSVTDARYLEGELAYLGLNVRSVAGPPTVQLLVFSQDPANAVDYASRRVQDTLLTMGLEDARCELMEVAADGRPR